MRRKADSKFEIRNSKFEILLALCFLILSCSGARQTKRTTIEFWGLGREGEVVADMVPEFERRNPGIRVDVQQIPWTAAHEKLLTAHVGGSTPDLAQMGNTWIPEFHTIGALQDLGPFVAASRSIRRSEYFDGIWQTNIVHGVLLGVPWYVDTRVLFYRTDIFVAAGFNHPPKSWSEWLRQMRVTKQHVGRSTFYPILLPTNEWPQPVLLALQKNATIVTEDGQARFEDPQFLSAFEFYIGLYRQGLAPVVSNQLIANLYQQFAQGEFASFISGPWQIGEIRRRLPADFQHKWTTAPLPGPDGTPYPGVSLAGGSSVCLFQRSEHKEAAWKFVEFLSEPDQQLKLFQLSGDMPAVKSAWDAPQIAGDKELRAFRAQLDRTVPTPMIPEWEHIATTIFEQGELAARGQFDARAAARRLDNKVNAMLVKRRWVVAQK